MRKRAYMISIRVNEEEMYLLNRIVKETGKTKREIIINALKNIPIRSKENDIQLQNIYLELAKYIRKVSGMANNINQMTKIANSKKYIKGVKELEKLHKEIKLMREEVMELWQLIKLLIIKA